MKCGGCKHWGTDEDVGKAYRECQGVPFDPGETDSTEPVSTETVAAGLKAVIVDASRTFAVLCCTADFGCELGEPAILPPPPPAP